MEIIVKETQELESAATQLLQFATGRKKFLFSGEIGAGKTTFIQAICRQLGVEELVTSPTFALVNEYTFPANDNGKAQIVHHIDLYRLNSLQEALDIGIEDYLYDDHYCFIEWPDLLEPILLPDSVKISIEIIENSTRKLLFL